LPPDLEAGLGPSWPPIRDLLRAQHLIPAWATIELERHDGAAVPDDALLGARCRLVDHPEAGRALLVEPSTEGPLASFLARHGEGWAAVYALADGDTLHRLRAADVRLSALAEGPLGPERRVLATPRSGPFIVLVLQPGILPR
jgi:hypothetical protein